MHFSSRSGETRRCRDAHDGSRLHRRGRSSEMSRRRVNVGRWGGATKVEGREEKKKERTGEIGTTPNRDTPIEPDMKGFDLG